MMITNEFMNEMLQKSRTYSLVVIYPTEKMRDPSSRPIVWEHGRRNFELRAAGKLAIVCPI